MTSTAVYLSVITIPADVSLVSTSVCLYFSLACVTCTQLLPRFTHDDLFLPPDRVMRCIERDGYVPNMAEAEKNMKLPLLCNRCSLRMKTMPALKTHLRVCSAPFKCLPVDPDPPVVAEESVGQTREVSEAAKGGGFQVSR